MIEGPPAEIIVKDPTPERNPLYHHPGQPEELIEKLINYMLEKGDTETSIAAWLSPILLVNKPDCSHRMCFDYRRVNEHLDTDIYPLLGLEELVDSSARNQFYATLDLKDAYYLVELTEYSRDLTTLNEGVALFRFTILPFEISSSPALFSRQLARVLAPLTKEVFVHNYLDNVILYAPYINILVARINKLLLCLEVAGVKLNKPNVTFVKKLVK